jgi:hypothetical protein
MQNYSLGISKGNFVPSLFIVDWIVCRSRNGHITNKNLIISEENGVVGKNSLLIERFLFCSEFILFALGIWPV